MLVLSRKTNQTVQLGENITVSILRIKGNVVQLGIEAPRDVKIMRSELLERDAQRQAAENQRAAEPGHALLTSDTPTQSVPRHGRDGSVFEAENHANYSASLRLMEGSLPVKNLSASLTTS